MPAPFWRLLVGSDIQHGSFRIVTLAFMASASLASSLIGQSSREQSNYSDPVVYWPRLDFVIPFNVDVTGQAPSEVQLELSEDDGRSWLLYSSGDVRTKQFHFQAKSDGLFQFRLKTLDQSGRRFDNPGEPLKIQVDTTKPEGKLYIFIDKRGDMQAEFEINDAALDTSTVKLEYQTEGISQWREIAFDVGPGEKEALFYGMGSWQIPIGTRKLVVRLTGKDKAGNSFEATRLPELPRSAAANTGLQLASGRARDLEVPGRLPPSNPIGSGVPESESNALPKVEVLGPRRPQSKDDISVARKLTEQQQRLIDQQSKMISQQQQSVNHLAFEGFRNEFQGKGSESSQFDSVPRQNSISKTESSDKAVSLDSRRLSNSDARLSKLPSRTIPDDEFEQLKSKSPMSLAAGLADQSLLVKDDVVRPADPVPTLEIEPKPVSNPSQSKFQRDIKPLFSNSKAFSLEYNIDNNSESPIASVELWGTFDQGQSWQLWGQDPDRASPFDIEVESEGLFGFRMVIVGTNGLVSNRPRNGDNADAWIHVDIRQPQAKIMSALYGKGSEAGSMIIEYRASDDYFADRPITLSYSATPSGPWQIIATGARNNGRYVWPADPSLPVSVYLKLEACDAAGNIGVSQLDLPIDVEGLAPRGRIQGFRPIK